MRLGLIGLGRIGAFHADTLSTLPGVDSLVVTDFVPAVTKAVAEKVGAEAADSPESPDRQRGRRDRHRRRHQCPHPADQGRGRCRNSRCSARSRCPVTFPRQRLSPGYVNDRGAVVQIGYPRRFDPAFAAARAAVESGELGWVHTVRSTTLDPAPAPRGYIEVSGGIFRDCSVHDFDTVRWITGREVVEVYATGSAKGADFFAEFGDVATAQTLLTFDDGATAVVSNTRYNARGYDVRLELHGTGDSVAAGWSDTTPLRNLEPGVSWPAGPPATFFMDRLTAAFRAELLAFTEVVAGQRTSPCTVDDAMAVGYMAEAATLSLQQHRPVQIDEVAVMTDPTKGTGEMDMTNGVTALNRIAGAPISWGVCEVPNWGYQLTPERVLAEMQDIGLSATELGPDGFLPADPGQMAKVLDTHHLTAVGGFTPVLMHQSGHDPLPEIDRILAGYDATDAEVLVLSAVSGLDGYDSRPELDDDGWALLLDNLNRISAASRRTRRSCGAASPRRHHDRDRRRCPAGPRGFADVAVPGHRAPADRWDRPGRTHPSGPRTGSRTPTSRTSTVRSRPRCAPAA